MRRIFEEENKLQRWLDVEAAVAEAQAFVGDIPKEAAEEIGRNANTKIVTLDHVKGIEKEIRHDLMAMVVALSEASTGEGRKYVHYGLTSYDIEDTATALQFKEAFSILEKRLDGLEEILASRVRKHRAVLIVGRTHGRHAGVITLGLKLAVWLEEVRRYQQRLKQVRERVLVGKILGIVGNGAGLGRNALKIQERALSKLGLKPAGLVTPALENIPLWHERDISNSASERFIFPMSFILVDEMLRLVTRVLEGLEVLPENMERNLELSQGSLLAERIVNLLVETGVPRQDAHERIRKISIRALDNKIPFSKLVLEDKFISKRLRPKEVKEALDYRTYLGVTRELVNLALKE